MQETWGRGFKKIKEAFERVNLTLPTVEENCGGVMVAIQRKTMDEVTAERGGNDGESAGVNVGNFAAIELSDRQCLVVLAIKVNPNVTAKAMSETLSVTQRTVERDLAVLQKAGIIRHEGKVNDGIWVVLEDIKF